MSLTSKMTDKRSKSGIKSQVSKLTGTFQTSFKLSKGSKDKAPDSATSSQRELMLSLTQNAKIDKNQLWQRMQKGANFMVQKENTAQLAGVADRPKGAELRRITAAVNKDLDDELNEDDFKVDDDMMLDLPDILWDTQRLRLRIPDMDGIDFWM